MQQKDLLVPAKTFSRTSKYFFKIAKFIAILKNIFAVSGKYFFVCTFNLSKL